MMNLRLAARLSRLLEHSVLTTDVARALRSSIAFTSAWVLCLLTGHATAAVFVATTAQNIAMVDVRGDYRARLAILVFKTVVIAAAVFAGTLTGNNVYSATLMAGALALLGGCWRHLSADYGPNLAVVSALLFLIALSQPGGWHDSFLLVFWVLLGGAGAMVLQLCGWFFRPQHPLRHAVAESWVAASDLILALQCETEDGQPCTDNVSAKELALRETVDRTLAALAVAERKKHPPEFLTHLEEGAEIAARLATRVAAFYTVLEPLRELPGFARLTPTLDSTLRAFANTARSAALLTITHRPDHFIAFEVRLRRCTHLMRIFEERLTALAPAHPETAAVREMLVQIGNLLPQIRSALAETVDHGAPHQGFTLRFPELGGFSLRSLGAWVNPSLQLDAVLIRYSLRVTVLTMLAVAVYLWFQIPRGYWIAFTAIVVLQPDYGSTREKAGQRILGTLAGAVLGSLLIWVKLPVALLLTLTAVMAFCFSYFVKRRYGLAIFFVTLMLVLITDAATSVNLDFTVSRLLSSLAGGVLALVAAKFFWPSWEREQFPKLIATAVRANRAYLGIVAAHQAAGQPFTGPAIQRKREAERANSRAAASLQRLMGEPAGRQKDVERAAALTAYNQRITRTITVLGLHLNQREKLAHLELVEMFRLVGDALETLAGELESQTPSAPRFPLGAEPPPDPSSAPASLVAGQLTKIATEIEAMSLAAYW